MSDLFEHKHIEVYVTLGDLKKAEEDAGKWVHWDKLAREQVEIPRGWEEDPHGVWRCNWGKGKHSDDLLIQFPVRRRKPKAKRSK